MKILVFDLIGEFAHFRAFYTNSSSISYGFPPRTVLMGIVASILGYERDGYYDDLSPENVKFSVAVLTPVRKFIQTINYIRTKKEDGFRNFKRSLETYLKRELETYQTPVELVFSPNGLLKYRVYFYSEGEIYKRLKEKLEEGKVYYSPYFGITELLVDLEYIGEFEAENPLKEKGIRSVIPEEYFDKIDFSKNLSLVVEKMPVHFELDGNFRKVKGVKKFIYERDAREVPLTDYSNAISVKGENIIWME